MGYYYGHLRETELKLTWEINQTINTNFDEFGICWVICQYSVHCQLQSNHSPDYLHTFLTLLGLNTHNIINIKRLEKYFCKDINIFITVSFKSHQGSGVCFDSSFVISDQEASSKSHQKTDECLHGLESGEKTRDYCPESRFS